MASVWERIRGVWTRSSRAQRIIVLVLSGTLALAFLATWSARGSELYRLLMEGGDRDIYALQALLEANGIRWRSRALPGGQLRLEVEAGEDFYRAYRIAEEQGLLFGASSAPVSFDGDSSFFTPPEKLQLRVEESKVRRVEEAILFNKKIASVRLMISRAPRRILEDAPREITAAVGLKLKPDAAPLTSVEVESVRDLVRGAFGVPLDAIHVVDHRGTSYGPDGVDVRAAEDRTRRTIEQVVGSLYLGQYQPWEFRLGVMVNVSARGSETEETLFDREGSFGIPREIETTRDGATGALHKTRQEVVTSRKETRTKVPPGEILGVGVNLVIDIEAVRRVLAKREALAGLPGSALDDPAMFRERLREYEREQESLIAKQIPFPDTQVEVSVEAFSAMDAQLAGAAPAASRPPFDRPWAAIAGGGAVTLFALLLALARRRRRMGRRPTHEEGKPDGGKDVPVAGLSACRDTIELARRASELAHERPDVAASILRLWLVPEAVVDFEKTP